jgi:glycosyltransferase involved in cell wall biosynthesis
MHVAFFTDLHPGTVGGAQISVTSQQRALEQLGHTVTVFTPPRVPNPDPDPGLVELRPVPVLARLACALSKYDDFVFVWPSRANAAVIDAAFSARGHIDIVHIHGDLGVALAGADAARRHGIPVVQTKHSRFDAYFAQATPAPLFLASVVSRMQKRHHRAKFTFTRRRESVASRIAWRFMVAHAQAVDHVIAPTRHFAQALTARGVNRPVSAVSNGIDDDVIDRAMTGEISGSAGGEPLRLVWCGRLSAEKRVLEAVDAVAAVTNCTLDIYGGGQLETALREHIESAGLADRIRVHGWISREECLTVMRSSDALLFTSYGFDTQGLVLLEAAAMSLPAIYCDGALSESVPEHGGLLAADASPAAIAAAIRTVVEGRDTLTDMAAALAAGSDVPRQSLQTSKILAIYRSVIESAPTGSGA